MPISLTDVDSVWDVLAILLVTVIGPAVTIGVPLVLRQRAHNRRTSAELGEIHCQVVNDHADQPNLREDIDGIKAEQKKAVNRHKDLMSILAAIRDEQAETRRDIGGVRTDIGLVRGEARQDRRNLSDLETRIHEFVRREHPEAPPL